MMDMGKSHTMGGGCFLVIGLDNDRISLHSICKTCYCQGITSNIVVDYRKLH